MRSTLLLLATLAASLPLAAEEGPFSAEAEAKGATQAGACEAAFAQAETEALDAFETAFLAQDAPPARRIELRSRSDERLGETEDGSWRCRVSATWVAVPLVDPADLAGTVQSVEGRYQAECAGANRDAACQRRIERQASADLRADLTAEEAGALTGLSLVYDGFEGSRTYRYQDDDQTLTMEGRFFFRIEPSRPAPRDEARGPGTEGDIHIERKRDDDEDDFADRLDLTLFHVWDGNDAAAPDDLALSNNRWGLGLWVDNRVGVSAFWGDERVGLADRRDNVHSDDGRYTVRGIGVGYRVFDNRALTLENMLHYVDAEPYRASVDPGCSGCTARDYESEDYVQASINIKTNTEGLNLGWMLTWKLRDDLSDYNSLSGGWYLELQF